MANPLPALDYAYSLLLQDENQREVFANAQFPSDIVSLMVGRPARPFQKQGKPVQRNNFPAQRQGNPANPSLKFGNQNFRNKGRKMKYNPNVTYTHYLKTWHVEDDCYRLIGHLDDFQSTNTREYQGTPKGNVAMTREVCEENENAQNESKWKEEGHEFSKRQMAQIRNMFKQMGQETTSGSEINDNVVAGPFYEEGLSFW